MKRHVILMLIFLAFFSCGKDKRIDAAEKITLEFFNSITNSDEKLMKKYYPNISTFDSYYKSDSVLIEDSKFIDDTIINIRVVNYYTNGFGKLNKNKMELFFYKDSINQYSIISDTKGLTNHAENELYEFAKNIGCIKDIDSTDVKINSKYFEAYLISYQYRLDKLKEFIKYVKVVDWSWKTGYSNYASGEGIVKNNTTFDIPNVKYKVTYMDRKGNVLTSDDGYVKYGGLKAGSSESFTFYTSYVSSRAKRASIELEFDEDLIKEYVLSSDYNGNEYDIYKQGKDSLY